jgi:hypothetical protein
MKLIIPTRDDDARVVVVPPELLPGSGAVLVALALGADGVRGCPDLGLLNSGRGATGSWPSQLEGEGDGEEQRQEEEEIGVALGRSGNGAAAARRPSAPVSALPESRSSLFF